MKTATIERPTCANCPYFQDFGEPNERGWCSVFDQIARSHHERTGACEQELEALKKEFTTATRAGARTRASKLRWRRRKLPTATGY